MAYRKPPGASGIGGPSSNPLGGRSKSDMRLARVLGGPSRRPSPAPASSPIATQEKIIVFSQWTSMLDLVEIALKKEKCVSLQSSMYGLCWHSVLGPSQHVTLRMAPASNKQLHACCHAQQIWHPS